MTIFVRLAMLLTAMAAVDAQETILPRANPQAKIQTLIITGLDSHDWRGVTPHFRKILEGTGRFDVRITEEPRGANNETFAPYDLAILVYNDAHNPEVRWSERTKSALVDFVRSGKGLVLYHHSAGSFARDNWEEFEKLCGGIWRPGFGQHSEPHDFTVNMRDPQHPIIRGLKPSFVQTRDELYANMKFQPAGSYHVLATAYDEPSLYKGKARQPFPAPGVEQPLLWTVDYRKGRVFATMLGHDLAAASTPGFVVTFLRGAEWAATGAVTLSAARYDR
jgi:type 1 glutamine amidotransferase